MTDATTNETLFERGLRVIPGGVNSPVRAFRSVGGTPYFVARAEGPHVWDVEGNRFIDMVQSYGAIILGHAHPGVIDAVVSIAGDGTSFGAPTEREVLLAEAICERVPSVEKVRLVSSGTEATMSAIRVARGATGRSRIVKFAGNYHGHSDSLLVAGGTAMATLGLPGSAGVTAGAVADTVVAPYNVVPELDDDVACVIVEPIAANMGLVPPVPGFLEGLRTECDRVGALLIFDEVITGFRVGYAGAEGLTGVRPDLACFGKVIGGGLPIGAYGGRADVMAEVAPDGPVYQAGTLSGNPLATAAGLAALGALTPRFYETLTGRVACFAEGLRGAFADAGLEWQVPEVATLVGVYAGPELPTDYEGAQACDEDGYARFFNAMLERGVAFAPGAYEVMFCGHTHTDEVLDRVVAAAAEAAKVAAAGCPAGGGGGGRGRAGGGGA
ncbi:MAG: glutamate-1-semialdehyde 2,1-aminomutase, partial [Acidimicrobiia bacterium]|nr:glutamate-1-semialdehyde 2,1-aminomutase [Acidimicrobiia bacterium]